jgi:hypothetical protein
MRFQEVDNLWTVKLDLLSNFDRGRVFYERAKQTIAEAEASDSLPRRGSKVDRTWLIARIGCGRAALNQNPALRALIESTDAQLERPFAQSKSAWKRRPAGARARSGSQPISIASGESRW